MTTPTDNPNAQQPVPHAGIFRGYPLGWTVKKSTAAGSESHAIAFQFAIHQQWHPDDQGGGQWSQEWPPGYFVYGDSWVINKKGELNAGAVKALADAKLWQGDFGEVEGPPPSVYVLLEVNPNTWEGKTTFRADWIMPDAEVPKPRQGGFAPADPSLLQSLRTRFGTQTRAIVGGKPSGPAPTPPGATPALAAPPAAAAPTPAPIQQPAPQPQHQAPPMQQPPQQAPRPPQQAPRPPVQGSFAPPAAQRQPQAPPGPAAPAPAPPGGPQFGDVAEDPERAPF